MPLVAEAMQRLDREIASARQQSQTVLKIIHGYGSSGVGGDIRIAVQKRLRSLADAGEIRSVIFGESWAKSDEASWRIVQAYPRLKEDSDLGAGNRGITIVLL
jgi:hypothetical protein